MTEKRCRICISVAPSVLNKLKNVGAMQGLTTSQLFERLADEGLDGSNVITEKLAVMQKQLVTLEKRAKGTRMDLEVLTELFSYFVWTYLCQTPEVPEFHKDAAVASGNKRHGEFMNRFSERLRRGVVVMSDILGEREKDVNITDGDELE